MSTPNLPSSRGKVRPQSTTTMSSPHSMTEMFLPISPIPPSGITRTTGLFEFAFAPSRMGRHQLVAFQHRADAFLLHAGGLDQWHARYADLEPEQLHRRL